MKTSTALRPLAQVRHHGNSLLPCQGINDQDPAQRILGTSWAEEMDILDPILDEQSSDEAQVLEVRLAPKCALWRASTLCPTLQGETCEANSSSPRHPSLVPLSWIRSMRIRAQRAQTSR